MTIDNLGGAIRKLRKRIPVAVKEATDAVAIEILETAADNTPVDTTEALSNWRVGVGSVPLGAVGPLVPGTGGSTKQASLQQVSDSGKTKLAPRKVGTEIHIANNAPHIDGLNDGSISQQPGQFVQKGILAGRMKLANTRLRLK